MYVTLNGHRARVLLDCGASSNYITWRIARQHGFRLTQKQHPYRLGLADGSHADHGMITRETVGLTMNIEEHQEVISFDVFDSSWDAVLGIPWLEKWNPQINWRHKTLEFPDEGRKVSGNLVLTKGQAFASTEPTFPKEYEDFAGLLEEDLEATALPQSQPWDHVIPLIPGKQPTKEPLRRTSAENAKIIKEWVKKQLKKGFIRESTSPAGYAITMAPKKDDKDGRVCIDFRRLNDITIKDSFPLPLILDIRDQTQGSDWFTKLDLRGAYNLVRMAIGEEWKTAFRTAEGLYEFMVMPFGLSNAPGTFQRLVNHVLNEFLGVFCVVYLDDILIFTKGTLAKHIQHVRQVLARLRDHKLLVKGEKCEFHKKEVAYLGSIISTTGFRMDPAKIQAIADWPIPTRVKDVQAFLGLANYNRRFIKGFSEVAAPLTELTKKDVKFRWEENHRKAFEKLIKLFTTELVLIHFNPEKPNTIEADASDYAAGACLLQPDENGKLHPVAYFSRKFTKPELNYEIHDKELLAIVEACREWKVYLCGAKHEVQVFTDHKNLTCFTTTKVLNRRQVRWSETLSELNLRISYRKGSENGRADALSRRADYELTETDQVSGAILREDKDGSLVYNHSFAATIQLTNDTWKEEIQKAQQGTAQIMGFEPREHAEDSLNEGLMIREGLVLIPDSLVTRVIQQNHDEPTAGHTGVEKTIERITRTYTFPQLAKRVKEYVGNCDICQRIKHPRHKPYGFLQEIPLPEAPWESVAFDFVTGLPPSVHPVDGTTYDAILVIVDRFTKMTYLRSCRITITAEQFANLFLDTVYAKHGMPKEIISDRDKLFTSRFWKSFTELLGTKHKLSTSFHPQTDGQTERTNQTVEQYLRGYVNYSQDNWTTLLPLAEFVFNTSKGQSGLTPHFALYGRHPRITGDSVEATVHAQKAHVQTSRIQQLHSALRQELHFLQYRMRLQANKKRSGGPDLKEGDLVYLSRKNIKTRRPSTKLDHTKLGPFKVLKKQGPVTYRLELPADMRIHPVFHVALLEPAPPNTKTIKPLIAPELQSDQYEVEEILDKTFKKGKPFYLIHWTGFKHSEDTWEPEKNISATLLAEYHRRNPDSPMRPPKDAGPNPNPPSPSPASLPTQTRGRPRQPPARYREGS
jgi:hypothetical protein